MSSEFRHRGHNCTARLEMEFITGARSYPATIRLDVDATRVTTISMAGTIDYSAVNTEDT